MSDLLFAVESSIRMHASCLQLRRLVLRLFEEGVADAFPPSQDEYSILNSKHFIGIHGYMIVYSVASKQSFEMARIIRDKILNHLVRNPSLFHTSQQRISFPIIS